LSTQAADLSRQPVAVGARVTQRALDLSQAPGAARRFAGEVDGAVFFAVVLERGGGFGEPLAHAGELVPHAGRRVFDLQAVLAHVVGAVLGHQGVGERGGDRLLEALDLHRDDAGVRQREHVGLVEAPHFLLLSGRQPLDGVALQRGRAQNLQLRAHRRRPSHAAHRLSQQAQVAAGLGRAPPVEIRIVAVAWYTGFCIAVKSTPRATMERNTSAISPRRRLKSASTCGMSTLSSSSTGATRPVGTVAVAAITTGGATRASRSSVAK
jgi:hypothetical protein